MASEFVAPRNLRAGPGQNWLDLLKVEDIGVFSNFFDMGGHSLLAGQVLARVANESAVSLPIRTLFEAPTIEALSSTHRCARKLDTSKPRPEIRVARGKGPLPVSFCAGGGAVDRAALPGLPQFNLTFAYRLQGPLNVAALERSLTELMRRHDLLRTGFGWAGERPSPPSRRRARPLHPSSLKI